MQLAQIAQHARFRPGSLIPAATIPKVRDLATACAGWQRTEPLDYSGGHVVHHAWHRWTGVTAMQTEVQCTGSFRVDLRSDCTQLFAVVDEVGGRVVVDTGPTRADGPSQSPNPISLLPIGVEAHARAAPLRQFRQLVLQFDPVSISSLFDDPIDLEAAFRLRPFIADAALLNLCRLIGAECEKGRMGSRLYAEGLVSALLLRLSRLDGAGVRPTFSGGLAPWQLRRVVDYMDVHFAEDVSLDDMARLVRLSATHFSRAFKRSTATSPHRWLIDLRCAKAKQLLLERSMRLAEIATATGFSDQAHFTRVFARSNGVPPATWRRAQAA